MFKKGNIAIAFMMIIMSIALHLHAVPAEMNYRGKLYESGTPVNGSRNLRFRIWNASTGGSSLWDSGIRVLNVNNGYYNYTLGTNTPIPSDIFTNEFVYLEVDVNGSPLTPRERFVTVAFAFNADRLDGYDSSDLIPFSAPGIAGKLPVFSSSAKLSNSILVQNNGKIGMNLTIAPMYDFHMVGNPTNTWMMIAPNEAGSEDSSTFYMAEDNDGTFGMLWQYDGSANELNLYGRSSGTMFGPHISVNRNTPTRIGIGTNNPTQMLDVNGNVKAIQFMGDGSLLTGLPQSPWLKFSTNIAYTNGNVGISTSNPAARFEVIGNAYFGAGGHETATFSVQGMPGIQMFNFRDSDSENVFKGTGSLAGNDLLIRLGDLDWINNGTQMILDDAGNDIEFYGNVGIGIASPLTSLHVPGRSGFGNGFAPGIGQTNNSINIYAGTLANYARNGISFWENNSSFGMHLSYDGSGGGAENKIIIYDNAGNEQFTFENGGSLGIRTNDASYPLDVNGTARMRGFIMPVSPGNGKVLMSDASGFGTWQTLSSSIDGVGTRNRIPVFTSATSVGNSVIYQTNGNIGIGGYSGSDKLQIFGGDLGLTRSDGQDLLITLDGDANGIAWTMGVQDSLGANFMINKGSSLDNSPDFVLTGGRAGFFTNNPQEKLHVNGNIRIPVSTTTVGIIYAGATPFIHNYGTQNTFIGFNSGNLTHGNLATYNAGFGANSLSAITVGDYNVGLGYNALAGVTGGGRNVGIGYGAGQALGNAGYNVLIGMYAGRILATGDNTMIGYSSGYNATGTRNVFLGYQAGYNETGDDKLYIDNSSTATPLIWGDFALDLLKVNGNMGVGSSSTPNANYLLYASRPLGNFGANRAAIYGYRNGDSGGVANGGTSWAVTGVDAAVKGVLLLMHQDLRKGLRYPFLKRCRSMVLRSRGLVLAAGQGYYSAYHHQTIL